MFIQKLSLKLKILMFNLLIVVSLGVTSTALNKFIISKGREGASENMKSYAKTLNDAISAQFYERYGDVQAFAMNPILRSGDRKQISSALNDYAILYGIYDLILVVDKTGRLVSVNEKAPSGEAIDTSALYEVDFSKEPWFLAVMGGKLTEDKAKNFLGTMVEDLQQDPWATKIFRKPMYGNSFNTALKDSEGNIIGVVSNRAGARWVEGELINLRDNIKSTGLQSAETLLISSNKKVLLHQGNETQNNIGNTFSNKNITDELGNKLTQKFETENHFFGLSYMDGPKFTSSLGWNTVIQIESQEALSHLRSVEMIFYILFAVISCGVIVASFYFSNSLGRSFMRISDILSAQADTVASTSDQVAGVSASLSDGATQQAASIQETAASIDQVSAMVKKNSDNAQQSIHLSKESREAATSGKAAAERMLQAIEDISRSHEEIMNQVEQGNKEIGDIVKVISEIAAKIKVINDIVFQTKLLSFNASVEAARAGEHGKGFAVVAEEVGNLAQMSGNAAEEIFKMLESSISTVEKIVSNTKSRVEGLVLAGKSKVEIGTRTAQECDKTLNSIFGLVKDVDQMVTEISAASSEQAQGVSEINKAINQLDQVTQQNSKVAQESASASGLLNSKSQEVRTAIEELRNLIHGTKNRVIETMSNREDRKILAFPSDRVPRKPVHPVKTAEGLTARTKAKSSGSEVPSANDPRFEDV